MFTWTGDATLILFIKGQSRLYFLRKLRFFRVCCKILHIFYTSVVQSAVLSAVICWGSKIRASDLKKLNKPVKTSGSVLEPMVQKRILHRMKNVRQPRASSTQHRFSNKVSSVRGFFRSTTTKISTEDSSCPQQ